MRTRFLSAILAAVAATAAVPAYAVTYVEGVDVDTYTAAFDSSGQPTRNPFVLTTGANIFTGQIASPNDAGDFIPLQLDAGYTLTGFNIVLTNSFDLGGNRIFFSDLTGGNVIDHSFSSFSTSSDLGANFYGLLIGGGTVQGDYVATFDVRGPVIGPIRGAVPEPSIWAMMIAGFGLVGGAMRRRQARRVDLAVG